jgi:ABC-type proline/glycine betaine transport system permease subunit
MTRSEIGQLPQGAALHHQPGLWKQTVETLVLVVAATAASMAIGVPLGIWAAHKPKVWQSCCRSST